MTVTRNKPKAAKETPLGAHIHLTMSFVDMDQSGGFGSSAFMDDEQGSYYSDEYSSPEESVDSRGRPYRNDEHYDHEGSDSGSEQSGSFVEETSVSLSLDQLTIPNNDSFNKEESQSHNDEGNSRGSRSYDDGENGSPSQSYTEEEIDSHSSRSYEEEEVEVSQSYEEEEVELSQSYDEEEVSQSYSDEGSQSGSYESPYDDEEGAYDEEKDAPDSPEGDFVFEDAKADQFAPDNRSKATDFSHDSSMPSFAFDADNETYDHTDPFQQNRSEKLSKASNPSTSGFESFATEQVSERKERKLPYHTNMQSQDSQNESSGESFAQESVDDASSESEASQSIDILELLDDDESQSQQTESTREREQPYHQNAQDEDEARQTPSSYFSAEGVNTFADDEDEDDISYDVPGVQSTYNGRNAGESSMRSDYNGQDSISSKGSSTLASEDSFIQLGPTQADAGAKNKDKMLGDSIDDSFNASASLDLEAPQNAYFGDSPSISSRNTFLTSDDKQLTKITEHSADVSFDELSSVEDRTNHSKTIQSFPNQNQSIQSQLMQPKAKAGLGSSGHANRSAGVGLQGIAHNTSQKNASGPATTQMVGESNSATKAAAPNNPAKKNTARKGYSREQMKRLSNTSQSIMKHSSNPTSPSSPSKKKKRRARIRVKSESLLELVANVNDAMLELEDSPQRSDYAESKYNDMMESSSRQLLHGFEALVGILLQLSDELELMSTFAHKKNSPAIEALQTLLSFAPNLDDLFLQLRPILQHYLEEEMDEEMNDLLYGMNLVVDLLCDLAHLVGEKQEWNARSNTAYVTLLELLARDALECTSLYNDIDTPKYPLSGQIQDAWTGTGHDEELKTLEVTDDLEMFRQICYEVMLSTDQWCPDTITLMDICGIDPAMLKEERGPQPNPDEDELAPTPETVLQVLEKISGEPLPRTSLMASVLRRILPSNELYDPDLLDAFASIRSTIRNPLGLSTSNLVAISSVPEVINESNALGVAGVGKTTLGAMVADHEDVRRFFRDGVAWVYVGHQELNYTRYVQCLRDLVSQLNIEEDEEPLFPELLGTPGESKAKRRRREEGFMIYVLETMVEFLQFRNVLIVLDDVSFEADLDWFDFGPAPSPGDNADEQEHSCVVLVTTRCRDLLPAADTVEVDMLDEDEAVSLLIQESGELSQSLVKESPETRSVVVECANHPLAVKSVGRWLNLKHATAGVVSSVEEIHGDVVKSMEKILKSGGQEDADMMYEIMNMSLSPSINGEPTNIIKFCFAAFVLVFCERKHISDFALADSTPIVPLAIAELLFESLLNLEEETLLKEGSLFYAQKKDAAVLIPEALSALGVLKVIITYPEDIDESSQVPEEAEEKYLQVMHVIQQEYGEFLYKEDDSLADLAKDAERRWNMAFAQTYLAKEVDWDSDAPDAGLDYALEMMPSHMIRGEMYSEAANLLTNPDFVRGRLFALGRENATRRHIKDCETLFDELMEERAAGRKKVDPKAIMKQAYQTLGGHLNMDEDEYIAEEGSPEAIEVGRSHFEIGFSLAEKRCWDAAIAHWESSQELLVSSLGMVEVVAGILYNVGVVYAEMNEHEQALGSLKQCLRIRGAIHGEEHILYAQTIQKIGDIFLGMSDYHEAMESYNWALDVMHIEPSHHRIDIGDILENMGNIHYSKGEIEDSLQSYQDALRSKQVELGEDHPELASTFHHIGNCLSDQGKTEEAIAHFEEAIRLKQLDPDGGGERDADVLTIEGVLHNLNGKQQEGLESYEKALQILVTKVPHKKEKVASLLHLIGCVYLMSGEHKKAMKLFEESLQARRKVLGFVHLDVASTLFNMAFLHQTRNRLDKALKCLEEALKIRQLRLPDSEKVAVTHEKIGTLARSIGKSKKAEIAFGEALRIRKLIHGESHEAVATVLQELGDLMDDLGEYDEAMKYYGEALDIRHNRLGPDDLAVGETLYSMGFTLQNNEASEKALQCFEESLSIRKFQLGEDAKEVGDTLNMMGFLQAKRGEVDEALALLWDALRIRKLHEDHVKVSETLKNIGNVHREKQEHDLAIECYEECLRIRRAELGDEHEKVADALIAMGNVHSDMDNAEEAMAAYKDALMIRTAVFGEHDESVAAVLQYMGTLEFRAGELDRALQLLREFIRIRQENGTENDGDYVNVLFMIGNIHKMQGNEEEAQSCWTEAYEVFQELGLADGNPQIAEVMGNLVKNNKEEDTHEEFDPTASPKRGLFGKITDKVKGTLRDEKLGIGRSRTKNRGQQL